MWCATEAEDGVTLLVKYIRFQGLELNLHVFSLDRKLPLVPLYNWQGEWQESATERSFWQLPCLLDSSSLINRLERKLPGKHYGIPDNTVTPHAIETVSFKFT